MIRAPRICIYGRLEYKFPYILIIKHLFVFLFLRATTKNWASIWQLPAGERYRNHSKESEQRVIAEGVGGGSICGPRWLLISFELWVQNVLSLYYTSVGIYLVSTCLS